MPLQSKVGSFALRTTTGNQSITGLGFQPKAVIFWVSNRTSDGGQLNSDFSFGIGISSSDRRCGYFKRDSGNAVAIPSGIDASKIIKFINTTPAAVIAADLVSQDADGFTINVSTTNGTAYIVNYMALGGDEITNAKGGKFQSPAPGNIDVTDVGFEPDLLLLFHVRLSATDPNPTADSGASSPRVMIGFGNKALEQAVMSTASRSNNNQAGSMQLSNAIFYTQGVDPTTIANTATLTAMLSNGFRLNFSVAVTQTAYTFYVALKGGRYKIGATNQRTTTGTTTIGSLGFKPQSILMRSFSNVATTSLISHAKDSLGAADRSGNHVHIYQGMNTGVNPNLSSVDLDRTAVIKMMANANPPSLSAEAVVSAWGDDSLTLDWTTVDGTAREAIYLIAGSSEYNSEFSAEIRGVERIETEIDAETTGAQDISDEIDVEMITAIAATDEIDAEITGKQDVYTEFDAEVEGAKTPTEFDAEIQGSGTPTEINAEVSGFLRENTEIDTEITGQLLVQTDIDAEIEGIPYSTEFDAEIEGAGSPTEIDAEISGAEIHNTDLDAEITGEKLPNDINAEVTGGPTPNNINAEITGHKPGTNINTQILGRAYPDRPLGYRLIIKNKAGQILGEHDSFNSLEFGKRLNNYGEANFNIRVTDPKSPLFVALRQNTIEIFREKNRARTLVWAGQQALAKGDLNQKGNNWLTVFSYTWFELLMHRYTGASVIYEETDMGEIIEDVVDTTNAEDPTGITIGTIIPTKDRDREYNNQNIGELMINGANLASGLDFDITDEKVLNIYDIMGTDRTDEVVLEYGHNIKNMTITEDYVNPINRAIVLGEAMDASTLQRIERDDAGLQTTYGLFEGRLTEMDVSNVSTLQDKGDAAIRKYGLALLRVEFELVGNTTPTIDTFGLGDGIRLIAKSGYYNIDEQYRVFEWKVKFDSKNVEKLELLLGKFIVI